MKTKLTFLAIIISISTSIAQTIHSYDWKSVTINGGGYVPGFVFSKATPNLLYARTDVGGIYRWDNPNKKWIPLSDFVTSGNQLGVISIAADPIDSNRVYMATGLYTNSWDPNGVFYSSTNKGATWTRSEVPFKVGGNEAGRGSGERLQVDPNMPNKLIFASQKQGVFQSLDYGKTWSKVTSFPKLNCTFLEIDPSSGTKGTASKDIYVGTYDHLASKDTTIGGLYKSTDGGVTWTYWAGQFAKVEPKDYDKPKISTPAIPNNLAFTGDNIFITMGNDLAPGASNGYVVKYNKTAKTWTKIYPFSKNTQGGYNSLSVHPTNPNIIVVGTLGYWWPTSDRVYITVDGGTTWTDVRSKMKINNKNTPHGGGMGWNSGLKINPFNPSQAVYGSGNGLWMTFNLDKAFTNDSTLWTYENDNFEETVPLALASPPSGAELISGLGDIKGFVHLDVTKSPADSYSQHGNTYSVDFAENDPKIIVRAHDGGKRASISKDKGLTWTEFASQAIGGDTRENYVSISPNGLNIIWAPSDSFPSVSSNGGSTWTLCSGLAENVFPKSDRVNSNIFYAINNTTGGFFKSTDGAKTFTKTAATFSFTTGGKIVSVFGKEGHVWLSAGSNGLHYTTDGGTTFTKITGVEEVYNLTFGKAKTGSTYPAVFIFGKISGLVGLYRSDDMGANWIKINTENQEFGRGYSRCMAGDPKVYGRLYIGTGGRGILYGQPEGSGNCFAPNLASAPNEICKSATISLDSKIADKAYKFSWYKDNVKLPDTTSVLTIGHAADYSVTATKTGCAPTTSTKTITSRLIDVGDIQVCKGNNATIAINGTSTYAWYDANNTAIDTALSLTIKPSASTQYTIKDIAFDSYSLGLPAYTTSGWGLGGSFDAGQNVAQLTVIDDVKLKGISLKVNSVGTKGVIRILDADGNIVTTSTKTNLAVGMQEIPFDIVLTAGVYKIDAVGTTGSVQFQADRTNIVLSIPNYATYAPVSWGNGIFFNLKFDVGNTCAPTPVAVIVHELPVITNNINTTKLGWQKLSTANVCAGTNVQFAPWPVKSNGWSWQGPKNFISTLRNPSINNLTTDQSGNYTATYVDSNGCSASAIYTITVNELPTATITSPSNSFCLGSALLLTASTGSSYVWKNGTTQVGTAATYSTSTVGTFTVEVTNANGCKAVSTVKTITGITPTLWYQDLDNDGKGDSLNKISACTKPTGYVADKSDLCPTDPLKTLPGKCGCGKPENCIITDIETSSVKENISVYPNPFHQQFSIEIEGKFQYTLEDMNGKMLLKGNGENHVLIDNNLQTGVYMLKITTNNITSNLKIVKN